MDAKRRMGRRVLLLSCSKRKSEAPGLLPVLERYDGPLFRVLRRARREGHGGDVVVLVLSARFGLLTENDRIPWYDMVMTADRARALQAPVQARLRQVLRPGDTLFVLLGSRYRKVLEGFRLPEGVRVVTPRGGIGRWARWLAVWLRQPSSRDLKP